MTAGAAPGYVDEATCELCHTALSRSYREKGMARAFRRPRPETDIEDFAAPPVADDTIPNVLRWWTHGADDLDELHPHRQRPGRTGLATCPTRPSLGANP